MDIKKTFGSFIIVLGTVCVVMGLLTPIRAEADRRFRRSTLATAPLAIPAAGVMECTAANLSGRDIKIRISQLLHFRDGPLPSDPFVIEKTEILTPGQATSVGGTVGSDPAIGRCTFEFKGYKNRVRAAAVVLEDAFIETEPEGDFVTVIDGTSIAAIEAK